MPTPGIHWSRRRSLSSLLDGISGALPTTLNEISEGAGAQEPAALVNLAEATRQLQQGLGVVSALVQRVEALEGQEKLTQSGMGELASRIHAMTGHLVMAIGHLQDAQEEASKPRGMFGGRK